MWQEPSKGLIITATSMYWKFKKRNRESIIKFNNGNDNHTLHNWNFLFLVIL